MTQSSTRSFSKVWYATPQRIASATKFVVFDDRGWLEAHHDYINFSGGKIHFDIEGIISISLVRQQVAWVMYLISNAFLFLWVMVMPQREMLPRWFLPVLLIFSNLFGIVIGLSTRWIKVEYRDATGEIRTAHFADGSMLGWGGIFGGTRKLYDALCAMYDSK